MAKKFIPSGDQPFATKAEHFARIISRDPGRVKVSQADADKLSEAAKRFRAALDVVRNNGSTRSMAVTRLKNETRAEAERHMRRLAHIIRNSEDVDLEVKVSLDLYDGPKRPKKTTVPNEPPRLRFVQALHAGNGAAPIHELAFEAASDFRLSKPVGAVRLELFVDLIPPEERVPPRPGANYGGRPWYVRSFTRSPIRITPPMPRVPMLVVYWGRWADSTGNVGPFSGTVVSRIEGWSPHVHVSLQFGQTKKVPLLEGRYEDEHTAPEGRDERYSVAVLDAQYDYFNPQEMDVKALQGPEDRERRQLEGPKADGETAESEAA